MKQKELTDIHPRIYYYYTAAALTGIAGLLHLRLFAMGLGRGINEIGIFFLVSGILQLFWVVPFVRQWGRTWYYIGLGGQLCYLLYGL